MPEALHMSEVAGNPLWDAGKGFFGFREFRMSFAVTQCCSKSAAETGLSKDEGDFISCISCSHFRQNPGTWEEASFFLTVCLHAKGCSLSCGGNIRRQADNRAKNTEIKCP